MTPPGPPTQPVAVHTGGREATLKWYPGAGGAAFKYQVYFHRIASRLGSSNSSKSSKKSSSKNMKKAFYRSFMYILYASRAPVLYFNKLVVC